MTIRPARPEDAEAIHALMVDNLLTIDGLDYTTFDGLTLVAERDGDVIGAIQALPGRPYAVITEAAVARPWHGRGVGVRLLDGIELALRLIGCQAWVTFTDHEDVRHILKRRGAQELGAGVGYKVRL